MATDGARRSANRPATSRGTGIRGKSNWGLGSSSEEPGLRRGRPEGRPLRSNPQPPTKQAELKVGLYIRKKSGVRTRCWGVRTAMETLVGREAVEQSRAAGLDESRLAAAG